MYVNVLHTLFSTTEPKQLHTKCDIRSIANSWQTLQLLKYCLPNVRCRDQDPARPVTYRPKYLLCTYFKATLVARNRRGIFIWETHKHVRQLFLYVRLVHCAGVCLFVCNLLWKLSYICGVYVFVCVVFACLFVCLYVFFLILVVLFFLFLAIVFVLFSL